MQDKDMQTLRHTYELQWYLTWIEHLHQIYNFVKS